MNYTALRPRTRQRTLSILLGLLYAGTTSSALAESGTSTTALQPALLGDIVITATRTASDTAEIPATVTAINQQELARKVPYDEAELFKDEPDIAMARDLRRFGATRVNIRGIEDNRVTQLVDGVRMADFYNGGGPTNFTMNAPLGASIEFLKQVEILRGPASSLYGSDAIGGVVGYFTLNPSDLIEDGKNHGARYRGSYNGINDGFTNTLLGAVKGDAAEFLIGYTHTDGHDADNQGNVGGTTNLRTKPNPQDTRDDGILAKLILRPSDLHRITLTLEGREQETDTEAKRLTASLRKVTAMSGTDESRRKRGSIEWEYMPQGAFFDRLTARLYRQDSDTHNFNLQTRSNTSATCSATTGSGNNCRIEQDFSFTQESLGGGLQFETATQWLNKEHLITYGTDISRVDTEELRDTSRWNLTNGTFSKTLAGDTFPLRDFANGRTETVGVFVQDEISGWANGRLTLTPGLRYDWRRLKPEVDALAQKSLTANNREAVEQSDSAFSPKLAALWKLNGRWSLYGQAVRGFRAPNYEEVNGSFRNTVQGYGNTPNPDLKPETSIGVEAGLKLHAETVRGQLSLYDNRYKNFIESVRLNCPSDPNCLSGLNTFMYSNLSRVRIYGAEMRGVWDFAPGWKLDGAFAWAHGQNESDSEPLNSVEPARASLGLIRDAGIWGTEARVRGATAVSRTDDSDGTWYRPAGYVVADLYAWWRPIKSGVLNVAVNNLLDKKYWLWSDIRQADDINPVGVDFYSQPGRTLSASFTYQF